MKNTFGNSITLTLFGESHGSAIGAVLDGLTPGLAVSDESIKKKLSLRRPQDALSTARREEDLYVLESGVYMGKTTGTPLCLLIPNKDTRSQDYESMKLLPRPSHADFTAQEKYHGYQDARGGGHFSGRITAALVAAGAILSDALEAKGIYVGTHIKRCAGVSDADFGDIKTQIKELNGKAFAVLDEGAGEKMREGILSAAAEGDSVGGVLETAVLGMPAGVGEPWFDTAESMLSHILFSIPAVKGVEFGDGFALADMRGSFANDPFVIENGRIATETNRNGGINGGITNGMPIIFRVAVKPTPTIRKEQKTVDMENKTPEVLKASGRHDPCIVQRARAVVDAVTALAVADMLAGRFGTDWLLK